MNRPLYTVDPNPASAGMYPSGILASVSGLVPAGDDRDFPNNISVIKLRHAPGMYFKRPVLFGLNSAERIKRI
ncbi:MAG TPA: hypothetical protein VEM40_08840 [Nitrospirota bacterium]|nr:hypothetical protein [Nitrospirota bacterium]